MTGLLICAQALTLVAFAGGCVMAGIGLGGLLMADAWIASTGIGIGLALIAAGWRRGGDAAMTALAREGQHCDEIAAAYRRGQEDMRERAAEAIDVKPMKGGRPTSGPHHSGLRAGRGQAAALIRALPIKGGDEAAQQPETLAWAVYCDDVERVFMDSEFREAQTAAVAAGGDLARVAIRVVEDET